MLSNPSSLADSISVKLNAFDNKGAADICRQFTSDLFRQSDSFPIKVSERILQMLRNKRLFGEMQHVAGALIQTRRSSPRIIRQYAQALTDQGFFTAALAVLNGLLNDSAAASPENIAVTNEREEARGLIGRVYKQLYVSAEGQITNHSIEFMHAAIENYLMVYKVEPQTYLWQGMNAASLICRAEADGIPLTGYPDYKTLAENILDVINELDSEKTASLWNLATGAEACIALGRPDDALKWIDRFVNDDLAEAFEIAGTLRQFTELWRLDMDSIMGKKILPILRAALLAENGGEVLINNVDLHTQQANEHSTSLVYEKVFGDESFNTYKWYMRGAKQCLSVARIGRDSSKGFGTGFLVTGSLLHPKLGNDPVLITNSHVVTDDLTVSNTLRPSEAIIIFEAEGGNAEFAIEKLVWTSPPGLLDTSVIQFLGKDLPAVKMLVSPADMITIAATLPDADSGQRMYVIGHPFGGTLQISLQDNLLLDYKDERIHYRTPTVGGSSGSPVFNRDWQLVGIHHAGSSEMPKLHGTGTYPANEGIWIQSVINAMAKSL